MCIICDGGSYDDIRATIDAQVARNGFAIAPVSGPMPWAYTVGLNATADHPELVVVDGDPAILGTLAECIVLDGRRYDGPALPDEPGGIEELGFVPVDPWHIERGLLATVLDYHERHDLVPRDPLALQVVLPQRNVCATCQELQTVLATPGGGPTAVAGPNRAARRAARHRRRAS